MKRYVSSANKFTNKATQLISHVYSPETILDKAANGSHKGESMWQVFNNIMHDPNVTFGDPDRGGNQVIFYNGQNIGWVNFARGIGNIDEKGYRQLEKYVEPDIPEEEEVGMDGEYLADTCPDGECYGDDFSEESDY